MKGNVKIRKGTKLIIDSGSTKSDWIIAEIPVNKDLIHSNKGLNPSVNTESEIEKTLRDVLTKHPEYAQAEEIFFYSAGCGTEESRHEMKRILSLYFPLSKIEVREDITGAALSVAGESEAYICILGTGSNAALWDGKKIHIPFPSLGYIIMDEGSANYFGKQLLRDYFRNKLPNGIAKRLESYFDMRVEFVKKQLYQNDKPNAYLGEFASVLVDFRQEEYTRNLLTTGFSDFIENCILPYLPDPSMPVHFIGSIAYHYEGILRKTLTSYDLITGQIIQKPIIRLAEYHSEKKE